MPQIQLPNQTFNITAAAFGQLTVTAGTNSSLSTLYVGMVGNILGAGGAPASNRVTITNVISPGVIIVNLITFDNTSTPGSQFDFTAYNGGTLWFDAQLASVPSINTALNAPVGGDLGGTLPNPTDIAFTDTDGVRLAFGSIPDVSILERSGNLVVGSTADKTNLNNQSGVNTGDETKATIATKTGISQAQMNLIALGAKATVSVTLVAFGTWVDGLTIQVPGAGPFTIKKTAVGTIDVSGAATLQAAADIVGNYCASASGSLVDYSGTVGQVMSFTAKAYGTAINNQLVSGTLLTGSGTMLLGLAPQISDPPPLVSTLSPGDLQPSDYIKLTVIASCGWFDTEQNFLRTLIPALT